MNGWDVYAAELADTMRGGKDSRPRKPCIYCGNMTRALSYVCTAHDDLPALEAAGRPRDTELLQTP